MCTLLSMKFSSLVFWKGEIEREKGTGFADTVYRISRRALIKTVFETTTTHSVTDSFDFRSGKSESIVNFSVHPKYTTSIYYRINLRNIYASLDAAKERMNITSYYRAKQQCRNPGFHSVRKKARYLRSENGSLSL